MDWGKSWWGLWFGSYQWHIQSHYYEGLITFQLISPFLTGRLIRINVLFSSGWEGSLTISHSWNTSGHIWMKALRQFCSFSCIAPHIILGDPSWPKVAIYCDFYESYQILINLIAFRCWIWIILRMNSLARFSGNVCR